MFSKYFGPALNHNLQFMEVLVSIILNGCFWIFVIKHFKRTKQINRIFKKNIFPNTIYWLFEDSEDNWGNIKQSILQKWKQIFKSKKNEVYTIRN